jgi:adenine deaminase
MQPLFITGKLADCQKKEMYPARMTIREGIITAIDRLDPDPQDTHLPYILPGFIDAHVHIESSMLVPAEFARLAVVHGTVATVSDPHEIANVCGIRGVEFMIRNGRRVPFKFNFGAPSCVPATSFETAGAELDSQAVANLLDRPEIKYLSEMMNFPGALQGDPEVLKKIEAAHLRDKPIDGHAPGLRGEDAKKYIQRGISTDHECFTREEALEKLQYGMKIIIREGSAAKNFESLIGLLPDFPDQMMFCSDDKHPDSLLEGHINQLCARAVAKGIDLFSVLQAACVNPVEHYRLDVGLLRIGDQADFILVEDLVAFRVRETWINGNLVASQGKSLIPPTPETARESINRFSCERKSIADFAVKAAGEPEYPFPVIGALDGQLITQKLRLQPKKEGSEWVSNTLDDVLKIVVINRYQDAPVAKAFIHGLGLKQGAIASTVAHDSHNIIAAGTDDESLCKAVNLLIDAQGGISCVKENLEMVLPLPVAGLMTFNDGYKTAGLYTMIDRAAKETGSTLSAPFMTLSFMALLVIPSLKLSDKGLFDGDRFCLTGISDAGNRTGFSLQTEINTVSAEPDTEK